MIRRKRDWLQRASGLFIPASGFAYEPWRFSPCAACCTTDICHCCSGATPSQFEVIISGLTDDSCNDCDTAGAGQLNNTFVLNRGTIYQEDGCEWFYEFEGYCNIVLMGLWIYKVANYARISVFAATDPVTWVYEWKKWYGTPGDIDCNLSSESIPWEPAGDTGLCDGSSSTCLVTAL